MRIVNQDGQTLAENAEMAGGFLGRLIGLMGRRSMDSGTALLLRGCSHIHTCFMHFPIDVVYADAGLRVLRVDRNVEPWTLAPRCRGAAYAIELPAGAGNAAVGDRLRLEETAG